MQTVPLKLVTIVAAEPAIEARLTARLKALGATGFTVTECRGEGSRGIRAADVPGTGVRIEAVVDARVADRIVSVMADEYFPDYAVIAWITDVVVVRGDKYVGGPGA